MGVEDAQLLEERTRDQSFNTEWIEAHRFTLTSSNFKRICHSKKVSTSLLGSLFDSPDLDRIPAIQHGRKNEDVAVQRYIAEKAKQGSAVFVQRCGLVLHTLYRFLGASPDRFVYDGEAQPSFGLLEVKCPYSASCDLLTVEQACENSAFCCVIDNGKISLRKNHPYYYQVQGQLALSGTAWCDFFVWLGQSVHVERVQFDEIFWRETMLPTLVDFYYASAVPYLQQKRLPTPPQAQAKQSQAMSRYETLMPWHLAQGTIAGRNGSSACTLIAAAVACKALEEGLSAASAEVLSTMHCEAMMEGNRLYESYGISALLSVDEVLALDPGFGLAMLREAFVQSGDAATLVDMLNDQAVSHDDHIAASIFVITPYSFAMCCDCSHFYLLDSHSHGQSGALIAKVAGSQAVDYIGSFFQQHYPHLHFGTASQGNIVGHLVLLTLDKDPK